MASTIASIPFGCHPEVFAVACLPISARCGSLEAGLESRKAAIHFWHGWAEAAGPLNSLCVNFFPGESQAVRSVVLRKSPVEAGPLFLGSR